MLPSNISEVRKVVSIWDLTPEERQKVADGWLIRVMLIIPGIVDDTNPPLWKLTVVPPGTKE